jgi:hypothetical protein
MAPYYPGTLGRERRRADDSYCSGWITKAEVDVLLAIGAVSVRRL